MAATKRALRAPEFPFEIRAIPPISRPGPARSPRAYAYARGVARTAAIV
jgi:hypothetical protein